MQIRYPIKTNFEDLDRFIGGLYPGEIMVFGSYPRVDRLSFLVTLIKKITLESGCKSLYFYHDLTKYVLRERLVSSISGISINKIHTAGRDIINLTGLTKEEARIFEKLNAEVCDLPIVIVETGKINNCCDFAREIFFKEKGFDIIFIDNLSFIHTDNDKSSATTMKQLKQLARDLNVPIVICEAVGNRAYLPNDLYLIINPDVLNNADVFLSLDRKIRSFDFSLFLNETIQILKNNFGDLGEINLSFSTETYSYEEYPASIKSSLIL